MRENASAEVRPDTGTSGRTGEELCLKVSRGKAPETGFVGPDLSIERSSGPARSHSHRDLPAHRSEGGVPAWGLDLRREPGAGGAFGRKLNKVPCDRRTVRSWKPGTLTYSGRGQGQLRGEVGLSPGPPGQPHEPVGAEAAGGGPALPRYHL